MRRDTPAEPVPARRAARGRGRPALIVAALLLPLAALLALAAPSIGLVTVAPGSLPAGVPTVVKVTAQISDPSVIPASVNLQRINEAGAAVGVIGALRDDGTAGDEVAGDKVFTFQGTFTETTPVRLRVSAGFVGLLRRVAAPDVLLAINRPPVADAGRPRAVALGSRVCADGRASRDPDADRLGFAWKLDAAPGGSDAALDDAARVSPCLLADQPGEYRLSLVVDDGQLKSAPAAVSIQATPPNTAPTADAGPDRDVPVGRQTQLDSSASSDPDPGTQLVRRWQLIDRPRDSRVEFLPRVLEFPAPDPSFVPDVPGAYRFGLVVGDGSLDSTPDEVVITAHAGNTPPTAMPGSDQQIDPGAVVELDGRASFDLDAGDAVAGFDWSFAAVPPGSQAALQRAATAAAAFTADKAGDFLVELVVTDSRGARSQPRRMLVRSGVAGQPVPRLLRLVPDQAKAGSPAIVLQAEGAGFGAGTSLVFGPTVLATRVLTPAKLEADLPAELLQTQSDVPVLVRNPAPGGGDSRPLTFRITAGALVLNAVSPSVLEVGRAVTLTLGGSGFGPQSKARFGSSELVTTVAGPTSLSAAVPAPLLTAPGVVPVTVADPLTGVSNAINVTVTLALAIQSVTPLEGPPGTVITILGTGFDHAFGATQVKVGSAAAGVASITAERIVATVPLSAESGAVGVSTPRGSVAGPVFDVRRSTDFNLVASPAEVRVAAGSGAAVSVQVASIGARPFTGIAAIGTGRLAPGISASLSSDGLSAGQTGSAALTAAATLAPGRYAVGFQAAATIDGAVVTRLARVHLVVTGEAGTTGVRGRFVDEQGRGVPGVSVRAENPAEVGSDLGTTATDAAGNYQLTGLIAGNVTLRFDATPAGPAYPIWPQAVWLEAGRVTTLPDWTLRPRPSDDKFTPIVPGHSADQVVTNPEVPGLSLRFPAGTTVTGWEGAVRTRASIFRVPADKLPTEAPLRGAKSYYMISFGAPMGGVSNTKIGVTAPNDTGLDPGQKAELYYFHGTPIAGPGGWRLAGTGTVSADGQTISSDPGVGIDHFCGVCGLWCWIAPPDIPNDCAECTNGPDRKAGNPISLSTGIEMASAVDMVIDGVMPIVISRTYHPWDTFILNNQLLPSMGHGWSFGYDYLFYGSGAGVRFVFPGNSRVDMVPDGSGALVAPGDHRLGGARLRQVAGVWELQFKDGRRWIFGAHGPIFMLDQQVDAAGNRLVIERNANGRPTTITAPGRSVSISVNGDGFIDVVRDALGREVQYRYQSARLESVRAPDGGITQYGYLQPPEPPLRQASAGAGGSGGGGGGGSVSVSAAIGPYLGANGPTYIEGIGYPGDGSTIVEAGGRRQVQGATVSNTYSDNGRVIRQELGGLTELRFAYELSGTCAVRNPQPTTLECAGPGGPNEDSYENHQAGWRFFGGQIVATTVTDGNGNRYKIRFDSASFGASVTDALGQVTRYERDARNRVTAITDPLGRTIRYEYDDNSNRTAIVDAAGRRTSIAYHPQWNKPVSVTRQLDDGSAVVWRFEYAEGPDTDGRLLAAIDPLGRRTTFDYTGSDTARALVARVTDPLGHATQLAYNSRSDLVGVTDALGNTVDFARDIVGRMVGATDALGATTRSEYNTIDQIVGITDAAGGRTRFAYDARRSPARVTDALGHAVESYRSDLLRRLVTRTDAKGGVERYSYDAGGRLSRVVDRKGQATVLRYDRLDRLVTIERADGDNERRSHDAVGRLVRVEDRTGATQFEYDVLDRVVKETTDVDGLVSSVEYEYDALDRRTKRSLNGGDAVTYAYDAASRLQTIGYRGGSVRYEWDAAGRLQAKTLPNGVRQEYAFDDADRLTEIRYRRAGGEVIDSIVYGYDANGRRVSRTMGFPTHVDTPIEGTYDEANRMTSVKFTASGETCTMGYDANGSLVSKVCPGGTTTYSWNAKDQLVGISGPGVTASFRYDSFGRRVERVVNGESTRFVYDGVQAIAETKAGVPTALLTGLVIDEMLARYPAAGMRGYLTDALGSVMAQSLEDGAILNRYAYSPYGETVEVGDDDGNSVQFTARENDGLGLGYFRARYFDSSIKRFLQQDTIGVAGGVNKYRYVNADPINLADPEGQSPILVALGAVGALSAVNTFLDVAKVLICDCPTDNLLEASKVLLPFYTFGRVTDAALVVFGTVAVGTAAGALFGPFTAFFGFIGGIYASPVTWFAYELYDFNSTLNSIVGCWASRSGW